MTSVVAFSGGKDSTVLVLRMHELGEEFTLFFTPTGNELPELCVHVAKIAAMVERPVMTTKGPTLAQAIESENSLPNPRMRWCTRLIKIVPCIAYLKTLANPTLCVGLRADEEERQGLYGDHATYRYPLREWGWGLREVYGYLRKRGVNVPTRTDCAVCPFQRLGEWWKLWRDHPDEYEQGVQWEAQIGHTFRSDSRDTWPASLAELRLKFEAGHIPRGAAQLQLEEDAPVACRVCSL